MSIISSKVLQQILLKPNHYERCSESSQIELKPNAFLKHLLSSYMWEKVSDLFSTPLCKKWYSICVLVCCRTTSVLLQTLIAFFMSAERWYGTLTVECTLCIYPTVPNKALLYLLSFSHHHQESHCKIILWKICIVQTWQTSGYGRIVLFKQD